jgi:hypothetical protein
MNDDDDGQRVERRNRKVVKTKPSPMTLMEAEQGAVVVLVLECSSWLGGPGDKDGPTDRLVRVIDPKTGKRGRDVMVIPRATMIAAIRIDDFDASKAKGE